MNDLHTIGDLVRHHIRDIPDYPQPGILFKDITPLLADATAFAQVIEALCAPWRNHQPRIDKVVGIEARGFILAAPVALALDVGFVPVRKLGKLPAATHTQAYDLEYGEETLEVHQDAFTQGERVLLIDDVLATGGTVEAAGQLIRAAGGVVVGASVLLEITALDARARLGELSVHSLLAV
ncbi:adenine phosphoribosyltransferase [Actinopolymorpha sp. B9G3]|uniref:adenine phosphoribosyltransferase n=1 Tax=Actinopolymorpha sp. B9G3 TaxID=3158970 RepID=UPI0032D8E7B3